MSSRPKPSSAVREERLQATIHEVNLMMARLFNRRVRDVGLTRSQWQALYLLNRHDGLTQTELADGLVMAKPPLGKVIDRLEKDGWVERRDDAQDRRVKRVFITQKVEPLIAPLAEIMDEIGAIATRGMSDAERHRLSDLLRRAHKNLSSAVTTP